METILTVLHLFLAIGLVGLVLIQHGKGADAGAAFGSGASATVFGSQGSANFLSRATAIFATLFFATSLWLAYFAMQSNEPQSLMEAVPATVEEVPSFESPVMPAVNSDLPDVPGLDQVTPAESDMPAVEMPAVSEEPAVQEVLQENAAAMQEMTAPLEESSMPVVEQQPADESTVPINADKQ
jgi:preprotein translocase subunit SecG